MKVEFIALLDTLLLGVFILIGVLIAFLVKKKQRVVDFSLGLAFSVILMLVFLDIIPEVINSLRVRYIWIFIIGTIVGTYLLRFLDSLIPNHENQKMNNNELKDNLVHIGIVSSIALFIHNAIEGMAIYSTVISNISLGLLLSVGVGFHNLPLGMVIATTFYQANNDKKQTIIYTLLVSLSTLFGGVVMFIFGTTQLNNIVLGLLLSITLGMLLYIAFCELYPRLSEVKYKESRNMGILIGVILFLISILI